MRFVLKLAILLMLLTPLAGCLDSSSPSGASSTSSSTSGGNNPTLVPQSTSAMVDDLGVRFAISDVGENGPEPSIGITSSGCMFFVASAKIMRSCDDGAKWESVEQVPQCQPGTSDPYLWVDPETDRIFGIQMLNLVGTWICWSDDDGETWLGNPYDQGPLPVNDHIKLATGPYTDAGYGLIGGASSIVYSQATYFCYNKLVGFFCYTSFDGGMTFPVGSQLVGFGGTDAGLHGAIATAPDGTVYMPPRAATPTAYFSKDNGLNWESRQMGQDVGTLDPRKNTEIAADADSNAYHVWNGKDGRVYLARSMDSGNTWDKVSIPVSPDSIISSTFPHISAGDAGRIAIAYLGSDDAEMIGSKDIDGNPWNGNPHYAPSSGVEYYMYVTYSLNALDAEPTFHTYKITPDPVQIGSICLNSGDCRDIGGSNRNLLDFNDLTLDREGNVYIAYADGCIDTCASDFANLDATASRARRGFVAIQTEGPKLFV